MGYRGPNPLKETLTVKKDFNKQLRDHYPRALKQNVILQV